MVIQDFEIRNKDKLDHILVELCEMVIDAQKKNSEKYGMVASCVLDTSNNKVCKVNYFNDATDRRVHAERAAIDAYHEEYGEIPAGSIIITTLSPCSIEMEERDGQSCTDMIDEVGVHKVYAGYSDPTQDDSERYAHKKFHIVTTRNEKIKELCKAFAATFLETQP